MWCKFSLILSSSCVMACCFGFGRKSDPASKSSAPAPQVAANQRSTSARKAVWPTAAAGVLPGCDPVRLLGEGTFGTVVLVRERSTKELFAVKVMNKSQLVYEGQLDNIVTERRVLREAGPHPFVVECHSGFQTEDAVVLVLEYLSGGDMYDLMKAYGCLSEENARFYLAEIVVGVTELHRHGFVFRDLKLENILVDLNGHIRLTDFGLAGKFRTGKWDDRSITDISGTAIYQAPEILANKGHGRVVDWWALGILAYVMLTGRPPFSSEGDRATLYDRIQNQTLNLDEDERLSHVSKECKEFIGSLLEKNPALRLGSEDDARDVQQHPFFADLDWEALLRFELEPPFAAPCKGPESSGDVGAREAADAENKMKKKLSSKHKPPTREAARAAKARGKHLDEVEYKVVQVEDAKSDGSRVSIGLDFRALNREASNRTWTGTTDDFGRKVQ